MCWRAKRNVAIDTTARARTEQGASTRSLTKKKKKKKKKKTKNKKTEERSTQKNVVVCET